jgi:hypothetical protein
MASDDKGLQLRRTGGLVGFAMRALRPGRGAPGGHFASAALGGIFERTLGEMFDIAAERRGMMEQLSLRTQWIAGTDQRLARLEAGRRVGERDIRFTNVLRLLVRAAFDESDVERLRILQNAVVNLHAAPSPLPEEIALFCETLIGLRQSQLRALGALEAGRSADRDLAEAAGLPAHAGPKLAADLVAAALAERSAEGLVASAFARALWAFANDTEC